MSVVVFVSLLVWNAVGQAQLFARNCSKDYELPCDNGQCVHKMQWCDGAFDCEDGTDEYFCDGTSCLDYHFRCGDGRCIPNVAVCDNYSDCPDRSDELCGEESENNAVLPVTLSFDKELSPRTNTSLSQIGQAIVKAANYLTTETRQDRITGDSVFRAIVALAFAEKIQPTSENEKELMKKQLKIQLSMDLMQNITKLGLSQLALRINALYALCENPRNFYGVNLVNMLRTRTDTALKSTYNLAFVLLTLCSAGEYKPDDLLEIDASYRNAGSRIGVKAIALMAMICSDRRSRRSDSKIYIADFSSLRDLETSNLDIYTKALYMQASNAAGIKTNPAELLTRQLQDGSFGDLLATYHAIPALLNTSILNVKCEDSLMQMDSAESPLYIADNAGTNITYSISINSGIERNSHSMIIEVDERKTFYHVMNMAATRDPTFRFMCDDTTTGKKVYSIAGIPNDPEAGLFWILYRGDSRSDVYSINFKETQGLDKIVPSKNEHFVFRMEHETQPIVTTQ